MNAPRSSQPTPAYPSSTSTTPARARQRRGVAMLLVLLALGVWMGHQTLANDLIENHPAYPIELSTFIAPVPGAPAPVIRLAPRPPIIHPVVLLDTVVPEAPSFIANVPRGPPAVA